MKEFVRRYQELLRYARRQVARRVDAEDLLQQALLIGWEQGRFDLTSESNRAWLRGVVRKRALFDARSATRARQRESLHAPVPISCADDPRDSLIAFIASLPRALRITALFVLKGQTRQELCYMLRVSPVAMRRRIADIRQRWNDLEGDVIPEMAGLHSSLPYGRIRTALLGLPLLKTAVQAGRMLGCHDPDGHLLMLNSQNLHPRQLIEAPLLKELPHAEK